jgi:hypothetical protein
MTIMRRHVLATVLVLTLLPAGIASACPNCKDSIPNSDAQQATSLPGGFNHSIYFMLGGLLVVGGFVVRMIVKESKAG